MGARKMIQTLELSNKNGEILSYKYLLLRLSTVLTNGWDAHALLASYNVVVKSYVKVCMFTANMSRVGCYASAFPKSTMYVLMQPFVVHALFHIAAIKIRTFRGHGTKDLPVGNLQRGCIA